MSNRQALTLTQAHVMPNFDKRTKKNTGNIYRPHHFLATNNNINLEYGKKSTGGGGMMSRGILQNTNINNITTEQEF